MKLTCLFVLLVPMMSCTSRQEKSELRPDINAPNTQNVRSKKSTNKIEAMILRLSSGKLKDYEVDEYFLAAESLVQNKQFDIAIQFYQVVFDTRPTLTPGLKLAQLAVMTGNMNQAENISRKLELLFPQSPEPILALAFLSHQKGDKKNVHQLLTKAYQKYPEDEEVVARYTEYLSEAGNNEKASEILTDALKKSPNSQFFMLRLAKFKIESKKNAQAKLLLDKLLRVAPENIEAWSLAAFLAEKEQNYSTAEKYYREAYDKQPQNDTLARLFITQLLRQGKLQEARHHLLKLENSVDKGSSLDPELTFQLAIVLFQLEEFESAKTRFQLLLDKADDKGRILYYTAQCEEFTRNYTEALKSYSKIDEKSEFYDKSQQRIVYLTLEDGRFEEAKKLIKKLAANAIKDESNYRFIASMYSRIKDYPAAIATVDMGLAKFPNTPELHYLRAVYLEFTASRLVTISELEKVIKRFPNFSPALNHLGYTLAEDGARLEYAIELVKRAVAKEPKNGLYIDSLAWAYFRNKNQKQANKLIMHALEVVNDEPVIWEHAGEIKLSNQEKALALKYFERSHEILKKQPRWKIENDLEWSTTEKRVNKRIEELKSSAITSSPSSLYYNFLSLQGRNI